MNEEINGIYNPETKTISGKASCFVVPNVIGGCSDFLVNKDIYTEHFEKLYELNGISEFNKDATYLVHIWMYSDDFDSGNIFSYGAMAKDSTGSEYEWYLNGLGFIPYDFIEGKVEGDVINIKLPGFIILPGFRIDDNEEDDDILTGDLEDNDVVEDDDEVKEPIIAEIELTLQQQGYIYKQFGNFEEAVRQNIKLTEEKI